MSLAQESFRIHKEALALKNLEALELENNIHRANQKYNILNSQAKTY